MTSLPQSVTFHLGYHAGLDTTQAREPWTLLGSILAELSQTFLPQLTTVWSLRSSLEVDSHFLGKWLYLDTILFYQPWKSRSKDSRALRQPFQGPWHPATQ